MSIAPRGLWQLATRQQSIKVVRFRRPLRCVCAHAHGTSNTGAAIDSKKPLLLTVASDYTGKGKLRLDAFLTAQVPETSRGKLQAAIKAGNVTVNGKQQVKTSLVVRPGDDVQCILLDPPLMEAAPEDIPLDVVYEDDNVMVVNKAAGMVVHPGPGNGSGTLVNAFLHHCNLPTVTVNPDADSDDGDGDEEEQEEEQTEGNGAGASPWPAPSPLRPGIVHRLDKGTTGLLVMAKDERSLMHLSDQFRARTVQRTYQSITLGCPSPAVGQVSSNIGRDSADRKKMAAFTLGSSRGRSAISGYRVRQPLGDGAAALVEWQLQTGRTHQIRVHAKKIGHSLFGDEAYGGGGGNAVSAIGKGKSLRQAVVWQALKYLNRPALHAQTLGFDHPVSGKRLQFTSESPADFQETLFRLDGLQ